jgi:hypothetical protein
MGWFPTTRDSSNNGWHFDIVGLLAVIGESTIADRVQAITASSFSRFPRLIPAPQTLLLTKRPNRLPSTKDVVVIGVHSGTYLEELNFFADVIHDIGSLKDYEFRVYHIKHREAQGNGRPHAHDGTQDGDSTNATLPDVESGSPPVASGPAAAEKIQTVKIPMHAFCPLNILTLSSIIITIGLIVWAVIIRDGVALVALATMSLSTSLACLSSQWYPGLCQRPTNAEVPPGDLVIKTRGAAFVVVHCNEEITRELYAGTEKCHYVLGEEWHKGLVATSTVMLMVSVVLLGNCQWTMQAAIGAGYIILNLLYWGVPLVAKQKNDWDMRRYDVRECNRINDKSGDAHLPYSDGGSGQVQPSFTRTLWYAIQETREITWIEAGHLAPKSAAWKKWLDEAKENCDQPDWDPIAAKNRLMREAVERLKTAPNLHTASDGESSQTAGKALPRKSAAQRHPGNEIL